MTKAGYGEDKTVSWFIKMVSLNLPLFTQDSRGGLAYLPAAETMHKSP
jgi:hypothetical protein